MLKAEAYNNIRFPICTLEQQPVPGHVSYVKLRSGCRKSLQEFVNPYLNASTVDLINHIFKC